MKIMIDPGHGGKFSGATCGDVKEKDINLSVSLKLKDELEALGFEVYMTRYSDVSLFAELQDDLQHRCNMEHLCKPDLFISIHCNSFSDKAVHGFEIFTSIGQTASDRYATSIFNSVKKHFPDKNYRSDNDDGDPDREGSLKVLRGTICPAVLVELGFLSNDGDRLWLLDEANQLAIAAALVNGITGGGEHE